MELEKEVETVPEDHNSKEVTSNKKQSAEIYINNGYSKDNRGSSKAVPLCNNLEVIWKFLKQAILR